VDLDFTGIDDLGEEEFAALENTVAKLTAVWEIRNLRGQAAIWHDDQHIGQKRRELQAMKHPSVNPDAIREFRAKAVVDSLEGNMLLHPLNMPVIVVNDACTKARAVWWSMGIEGLSKFRERPMAIVSLGMVPGTHIREDGEWRILNGAWQRTTKNEYHADWVHDMQPTNTRPPLTPEQDRNFLGKYAYRPDEVRKASPEPPADDTWEKFPDEADMSWLYVNLEAPKAK